MTETDAGPERQAPPKGSRLRGALGAFLGAFFGALFSDLLLFLLPDEMGELALLAAMILVGWTACRGYRLLRGYRSMRFAQWTVRLALIPAQPLALILVLTLTVLRQAHGTLPLSAEILPYVFARSAAYLLSWDSLRAWGLMTLCTLFFCRLSWTGLLKYVDPAWYSDPRRLARVGGGGATFNMPPCWPLPPAESIPTQFSVDKGKLTVEGSTLTFKPWAKPRRSFQVTDIAGVVLGVSSGFNILYDRENRELARFAWSRQNALLLGQYLLSHGVPFVDLSGAPVSTQSPAEPGSAPSGSFTLRQPKLASVVGWACLLFFGAATALSLWLVEFPTSLLCGGFFFLMVLLALYLLLARRNQRLEVDGQQLAYTSPWGKTARFRLSDIARGVLTTNRLKLLDREGGVLAKLGMDMENASLLNQYLQAHQVPLGPSKSRKE